MCFYFGFRKTHFSFGDVKCVRARFGSTKSRDRIWDGWIRPGIYYFIYVYSNNKQKHNYQKS